MGQQHPDPAGRERSPLTTASSHFLVLGFASLFSLFTGWEAVAQWNEMSDYRSSVGLTLILLGKFTGKNSIPVFYLFSFQALVVKEGRRREIEQGMNSVRGREKLQ